MFGLYIESFLSYFNIKIEWYATLSKACYDCPFNKNDCSRPHCIHADGVRRSVLVINRMMPGPMIDVCKGDTIIVDVENSLMGESTTIHWHGLHQRDSEFQTKTGLCIIMDLQIEILFFCCCILLQPHITMVYRRSHNVQFCHIQHFVMYSKQLM